MKPNVLLLIVVSEFLVGGLAGAQVTLTNKDVEEHTVRPIPIVRSPSRTHSDTGPPAPPPPRGTYRPPARDAGTWQYDTDRREPVQPSEPLIPTGPDNAQERLDRMIGNMARSTNDFDSRRYSGTTRFQGDVSIRLPSLPEGNYAHAFCTDARAAYRLQGHTAQVRISRAGRPPNAATTSVRLSGGVYNFNMTHSGGVSFDFDLPREYGDTEGYVAYTVLPLHKQMRLKMKE